MTSHSESDIRGISFIHHPCTITFVDHTQSITLVNARQGKLLKSEKKAGKKQELA
jgi:hypothetical protein